MFRLSKMMKMIMAMDKILIGRLICSLKCYPVYMNALPLGWQRLSHDIHHWLFLQIKPYLQIAVGKPHIHVL